MKVQKQDDEYDNKYHFHFIKLEIGRLGSKCPFLVEIIAAFKSDVSLKQKSITIKEAHIFNSRTFMNDNLLTGTLKPFLIL